ncbi:MAG: phosphoribosylaminoimidazolesuccinocarboxamide synthase [Verrucomicrobiota bacterium]
MTYADVVAKLPKTARREIGTLSYPHLASGKVREIYDLGEELLMIASDRLSAFDVILPDGIPGKGMMLTQASLWWFNQTKVILPNHLVDNHASALEETLAERPELIPYSMRVKKLAPVKLEAVVRGYLAGSGWKEYRDTGRLVAHPLPENLLESSPLPEPLFTPTTKADAGHDLPITEDEGRDLIGAESYEQIRAASLQIFALGSRIAEASGLILADTKFEFGTDDSGRLYLIDEVLTPDSSRYWPKNDYTPGRPQTAYDKQFVRDYLETLDWDKTYPGPELPESVIGKTQERYLSALKKLWQQLSS